MGGGRDAGPGDRGAVRRIGPDCPPGGGRRPLARFRVGARGRHRSRHRVRDGGHGDGRARCVRSRLPRRPSRLPAHARAGGPPSQRQRMPPAGAGTESCPPGRDRGPGRPPGRQPCPPRSARRRVPSARRDVCRRHGGRAGGRARSRPVGRAPPCPGPRRPGGRDGTACRRRPHGGRAPLAPPRQGAHPAARAAGIGRARPRVDAHGARAGARAFGVSRPAAGRLGRRRRHRRGEGDRHRGASRGGARVAL